MYKLVSFFLYTKLDKNVLNIASFCMNWTQFFSYEVPSHLIFLAIPC